MGHALGISSLALVGEDDGGNPWCMDSIRRSLPGVATWSIDTASPPQPTWKSSGQNQQPRRGADPVFTVGEMTESGVLFKGTHVSEVLAGALNGGLPIEGFEGDSLDLLQHPAGPQPHEPSGLPQLSGFHGSRTRCASGYRVHDSTAKIFTVFPFTGTT